MSTEPTTAPVQPEINLNPDDAEQRSLTSIYRVKSSGYGYSSDDYYNKAVASAQAEGRAAPPRQLQWTIEWEGLDFRFEDHPDENPIITRSVNVTDKNGAPATWGNPADPEPTSADSFPIQMSKYFAKCGVKMGNDPHILDGMVFVCEQRELRAGSTKITPLVPVLIGVAPAAGSVPRLVHGKEKGTAGNPATAAPVVPAGPSKSAEYAKLAAALGGKKSSELVPTALAAAVTNSDVLAECAQGAPAIEALKAFGSFSPEGVFTHTVAAA